MVTLTITPSGTTNTNNVTAALTKTQVKLSRGREIEKGTFSVDKNKLTSIYTPSVGDTFSYTSQSGVQDFEGKIVDIQKEIPVWKIKAEGYLTEGKNYTRTRTWTNTIWTSIFMSIYGDADSLDAETEYDFAVTAEADDTVHQFSMSEESLFRGARKAAEYGGNTWLYAGSKAYGIWPITYATTTASASAGTAGAEILNIPKWYEDTTEIYNNITLYYSGGSTSSSDSTSITDYGERQRVFYRKDITDSTAASDYVNNLLTKYKDPQVWVEFKIDPNVFGDRVLEYELTINDYINDNTGSSYIVTEAEMMWPKPYWKIKCGNIPAILNEYVSDIDRRAQWLEDSVDQDVKQSSGPTFDSLSIGGTEVIDSLRNIDNVNEFYVRDDADRYLRINRSAGALGNVHIDSYYTRGDDGGNIYFNWFEGKSLIYGGGAGVRKFEVFPSGIIDAYNTINIKSGGLSIGNNIKWLDSPTTTEINNAISALSLPGKLIVEGLITVDTTITPLGDIVYDFSNAKLTAANGLNASVIKASTQSDILFFAPEIDGNKANQSGTNVHCMVFDGCSNIDVIGGKYLNALQGGLVFGECTNFSAYSPYCEGNTLEHIYITGADGICRDGAIYSPTLIGNAPGINFKNEAINIDVYNIQADDTNKAIYTCVSDTTYAAPRDITIYGGIIRNDLREAVDITDTDSGGSASTVETVKRISLRELTVLAASSASANTYDAIKIRDGERHVIETAYVDGASHRYDLLIGTDAVDVDIRNSVLTGAGTYSYGDNGTRTRLNHIGEETANAETPTAANWDVGNIVDFTDSGDGSGDGVYTLLPDGSWSQIGT